jgi:hypothetical protein
MTHTTNPDVASTECHNEVISNAAWWTVQTPDTLVDNFHAFSLVFPGKVHITTTSLYIL